MQYLWLAVGALLIIVPVVKTVRDGRAWKEPEKK
jgi:hypothetical protein